MRFGASKRFEFQFEPPNPFAHYGDGTEWDGTEQNGTEWDGTERNRTEVPYGNSHVLDATQVIGCNPSYRMQPKL